MDVEDLRDTPVEDLVRRAESEGNAFALAVLKKLTAEIDLSYDRGYAHGYQQGFKDQL